MTPINALLLGCFLGFLVGYNWSGAMRKRKYNPRKYKSKVLRNSQFEFDESAHYHEN